MPRNGPITRIALLLLLAGLLAVPEVIHRRSARAAAPIGPTPTSGARSRYGFVLRDVTAAAGIDFVHQAPHLDAKLEHIMPQIASMGAAVSVVDFDRDGWPDLYVVNSGEGSRNRLYRNTQDGTFKDVAGEMGVADLNQPGTGACMGAVWADYDNDGFEDL